MSSKDIHCPQHGYHKPGDCPKCVRNFNSKKPLSRIARCEKHDTTFMAEEGTMFDRCFVCVFEENTNLALANKSIAAHVKCLREIARDLRASGALHIRVAGCCCGRCVAARKIETICKKMVKGE